MNIFNAVFYTAFPTTSILNVLPSFSLFFNLLFLSLYRRGCREGWTMLQIKTNNKMLMVYNECLKLATMQKNKRDKRKNLLHYFVVVTLLLSSLWREQVLFISSQQQDVCAQENDDLPLYLSCHIYLCIQMSTVCPGDTYNVTCTLFSVSTSQVSPRG